MKELMYDNYIYGFSKLLDGIFLMNNHKRMVAALNMFQFERLNADKYNRNVKLIADTIYYYNKINLYCMEGNFDQGIQIIPTIEQFITENYNNLELHKRMLFHYKIACLYFGSRQYDLCIEQLRKINETKRSLEEFSKTAEGKKVMQQIGTIDKNKLMNLFMSMDTKDLKDKLSKADLSKLSQSDIKNVMNKIK
jgi:hypothetical protein